MSNFGSVFDKFYKLNHFNNNALGFTIFNHE